ncbi:hypothetical protein AZA_88982 [Nitrospirillum viridazoti Y2]|nr:hypothetical protein AZA_88982 [Nitrospirillum amazonense Y2]
MVQDGKLTDILLMRHLATRRQTGKDGAQARLHRVRLQGRHQQHHRHQRVAPKIGVEAPGPGQQLFLIAEEGQGIAAGRLRGGAGVQQMIAGQRGQRRLPGQRRDAQAYGAIGASLQARRRQLAAGDRHRQAIAGLAVQAVAGPVQRIVRAGGPHLHLGGQGAQGFIVAQHPGAGQHALAGHGAVGPQRRLEHHPAQGAALGVGGGHRLGRAGQRPAGGVRSVQPQAHAAVAGGKGHQDARVLAGAQQQVGRHRALTHKGVEVAPLRQAVGQGRLGGRVGEGCRRPGQRQGQDGAGEQVRKARHGRVL